MHLCVHKGVPCVDRHAWSSRYFSELSWCLSNAPVEVLIGVNERWMETIEEFEAGGPHILRCYRFSRR